MSVTHLILREHGPHTSVQLQGCHVLETSLDHLSVKQSARSTLSGLTIGSVLLEDLHLRDLPENVRAAIFAGNGVSRPVSSRWTNPDAGNSL